MQLAGKIIKDGVVVGRIQMGDDGAAVVYVGASGTETLKDDGGAVRHVEILTGGAAATVEVSAPIVLTGKELGDFPDTEEGKKQLRKAAMDKLAGLEGQMIDCPAIGEGVKVEIRKRGIKEFKRFSGNPLKLKAVAAIQEIIKHAKSAKWEENHKPKKQSAEGYYHIDSSVSIDGVKVDADVVIEKDENGLLHYDYIIRSEKAASLDGAASSSRVPPDHKSGTGDGDILNTNQNQSQAIFDSTGGEYVLNLFLKVKDPVTGEWVEVPDEPIEFDEAGDGQELLSEQGLQDKATALGIVCEHIEAVGGDVLWATLSKNGVSANLNKNANGAWSLTKNPDGDILSDITNSTVDGNLAVMAMQGQTAQVDVGIQRKMDDELTYAKQGTFSPSYLADNREAALQDYFAANPDAKAAHGAAIAASWESQVAPAIDPQKTADLAYFQSVIDGKEDMLDPEFADKLEGAYIRHAGDVEIESLFNDALAAYEKNMLAEAAKLS